ncbi:MAG: hypothetical protein WAW53_00245 [Candidatus Dormiibacterota bacterium]
MRGTLVIPLSVVIALSVIGAGSTQPPKVLAASCPVPVHYYGWANSGFGTTIGTAATTTTWSAYSVQSSPAAFSDEASWLTQTTSNGTLEPQASSIEGGFYSGQGVNPAWTTAILPYWTETDGGNEHDYAADALGKGTGVTIYVEGHYSTQAAKVEVGGYSFNLGTYVVNTPRGNYAQGEVDSKNTSMGGGSGESFTQYFEPESAIGQFGLWGALTVGYNSPFLASRSSSSVWSNSGYGSSC